MTIDATQGEPVYLQVAIVAVYTLLLTIVVYLYIICSHCPSLSFINLLSSFIPYILVLCTLAHCFKCYMIQFVLKIITLINVVILCSIQR